MIVELVGPSGAGKSTLARLLRDHLGGPESAMVASDLVMDRPLLRKVHNAQVVNLVQDACALPHLTRTLPRHADLLRLSARVLAAHAPSRLDLVLNTRSVMRRIGMFELARSRSDRPVVLVDEGPALIAYHLFVYSTAEPTDDSLARFADCLPLPDLLVYVRSPLSVLTDRAFSRPDRRRQLAGLTRREAERPLRRALQVFDRLVSTERLQDRTLVVANESASVAALDDVAARLATTVRSLAPGPRAADLSTTGVVLR